MKLSKILSSAAAAAVFSSSLALGLAVSTDNAQARTYTKQKYFNRDKCYRAVRVPATVEYDTRGIKVRDASRSWIGNPQRHGAKVIDKYNDPVYIQTQRILEDQHVTLVPTGC
ncbi:MAG: hypothetical protein KDK08_08310 [Rhizobiaceae bacterium]|nr:hypothetical protein [Rhizobiaceae bacterium]